ncbi:MAG: GNAT family N-acetyltransferase [Gammaproteobacteria bacterium]|nr:GNAT family N-acetyltransferase [Gammaproteobacteria bacterium]MDH4254345.1 GNAT family N-acetyltransferase [Gammaproteobacteria bacterium]MDH5309603.1 GNAT family N-acetyltransferase [Gammaproteobacteria bacterium]
MADARNIIIRPANRADVDAMHAMVVALGTATGAEHKVKSTPLDLLRHGFGAEPAFEALIADRDGEAVGLCIYGYVFSTWRGDPGVYVIDLFVDDSARGAGLGERLLREAARAGIKRNASHLRLSVDRQNEGAQRFYERIGMVYRKDEHIYQISGDDFAALAGEPG